MQLIKRIVSKMSLLQGHELVAEYNRYDSAIEDCINKYAPQLGELKAHRNFSKLEKNGYSLLFSNGSIEVIYKDNFVTEIYLKAK